MKRKEAEKLKKAYLEQKTNKINHKQHANRPNYRKAYKLFLNSIILMLFERPKVLKLLSEIGAKKQGASTSHQLQLNQ